ncbi:MAG: TonB-dependent receptor plug domain-containing protein, partial [Prolixibacteraceae bacterium]
MSRFFFFAVFFILTYSGLMAQQESVMDSVLLDEVTATADAKKYQAGSKIESIPADQIQASQEGGIDQILMRFTAIYLKSNAGGLSSIRFRGTSANHTSVNFGAINVNSLTLGSADMSAIPSYLFDGIDIQYGSSSAVNGSGAIGGSLSLGLQSNWTDGLKISAKISQGSFGEQFYGTKVFAGNGKWESVSRLYYFYKKNDFPFKNPYTGNVENRDPVDDRQHGANIENMGLIQELNYRFSKEEQIKSAIWLEHDWHQVQPNMQTNLNFVKTEELDNKNIRFWSEYQNNKHGMKYRGGLGYVHDMQVYDNDQLQKIETDRIILEAEVNQDISGSFGYKAGAKYQYLVPNVYAYSDSMIDSEQHIESYLSSFLKIWNRLKLTLNLRQVYVTNFSVPFTPSVGAEYHLFSSESTALKLTSNIASSYRVPTFN